MAATTDKVTTVCCPGKVLVAGGYLVLESPNPGLVFGADGAEGSSRFFSSMTTLPSNSNADLTSKEVSASSDGYGRQRLDVHSPQFDCAFQYWLEYVAAQTTGADVNEDESILLRLIPRSTEGHKPNPYVEKALSLTLAYIQFTLGASEFASNISEVTENGHRILSLKLRAGNDFYSPLTHLKARNLEATPGNVASLPQFLPCPKAKDETNGEEKIVVNKTGMGSSAALVTSVVGAVLSYFDIVSSPTLGDTSHQTSEEDDLKGKEIVHNLAQICHCSAQGKVGSGFDVSAATYGTHVYRRFGKGVLSKLLDDIDDSNTSRSEAKDCFVVTKAVAKDMTNITNDANGTIWDAETISLALPPGLELLMADVCGGSESPSMARKVLAWKKEQTEASDILWERLKTTNASLEELFVKDFASPDFLNGVEKYSDKLASTPADKWVDIDLTGQPEFNVVTTLLKARYLFMKSRKNLKAMGGAAGVPIEPEGQTALADATMALPGVVAAGVPGAGGYDALFVLYVKGRDVDGGQSDEVREKIGELWRSWADKNPGGTEVEVVCPLAVRGAGNGSNFGICSCDLGW